MSHRPELGEYVRSWLAREVRLAPITELLGIRSLAIEMRYLQPVREGGLLAAAKLLRRGKTAAYFECESHDGARVAKATSVLMVRRRNSD